MKDEIILDLTMKADEAMDALIRALGRVRTGRAHASMLDSIRVDYYGTKSPLNQVASVVVADARLITVKPFDRSMTQEIERVLRSASDLGISPQNDGEKILLPIPPLTEDRRREFSKVAKSKGEEAKVSVRNARREANEALKKAEKEAGLPEDDVKKAIDQVQKMTDDYVKKIEDVVGKKEKEIMEV